MRFREACLVLLVGLCGCRGQIRRICSFESRPNVLIVATNGASWEDFGFSSFYLKDYEITPNLNALCKEGAYFSSAYLMSALGDGAMAAMLTGMSIQELGYEHHTDQAEWAVDAKHLYLSEYLDDYTKGFFGKWNLGGNEIESARPDLRGFNYFYGFLGNISSHFPWQLKPEPPAELLTHLRFRSSVESFPGSKEAARLLVLLERWYCLTIQERQEARRLTLALNLSALESTDGVEERAWPRFSLPRETIMACKMPGYHFALLPLQKYLTTAISERVVDFITYAPNYERPWLAVASYNVPYVPLEAEERLLAKFHHIKEPTMRTRAAMLASFDEGIGKIVETLKRTNQWDNTIIIFLNNESISHRRMKDENVHYRGCRGTLFEGGLRTPMFVVWPQKIAKESLVSQPVSVQDIVPSLLKVCEAERKHRKQFEGNYRYLFDVDRQENLNAPCYFWRHGKVAAIRNGKWKLILISPLDPEKEKGKKEEDVILLYDLENDPQEHTNVADVYQSISANLAGQLRHWCSHYPLKADRSVSYWEKKRHEMHLMQEVSKE